MRELLGTTQVSPVPVACVSNKSVVCIFLSHFIFSSAARRNAGLGKGSRPPAALGELVLDPSSRQSATYTCFLPLGWGRARRGGEEFASNYSISLMIK